MRDPVLMTFEKAMVVLVWALQRENPQEIPPAAEIQSQFGVNRATACRYRRALVGAYSTLTDGGSRD